MVTMKFKPNREFPDFNNSFVCTDKPIICASCGVKYDSGFLTEIKGAGLYCQTCFKSTFIDYFKKHPDDDYVLIRMVRSGRAAGSMNNV